MAFGQQSGPPATAKQVQELLGLLEEAGHSDFRDARGPMGFTQRQAAGKFTRDEADAFIEQLRDGVTGEGDGENEVPTAPERPAARPAPRAAPRAVPRQPARMSASEQALRRMPTEQLAAELQRRGWVVMEP